jgi:palmitoyl-protein thioesterase
MRLSALPPTLLTLCITLSHALPQQEVFTARTRRPLVIWHGMGDSYASEGMLDFAKEIGQVHEGIFVHSIYLDEDLDEDRRAGFVRRPTILERLFLTFQVRTSTVT